MGYKVLLAQNVAEEGKQLLRENNCEIVLAPEETEEAMVMCIADCDAVFSASFFLNERILSAGKKLKVVAKHGVGIENVVDLKTATKLGLYVVNTPFANMDAVAEHTVAGMLSYAKKIVKMDAAARALNFTVCQCGGTHELKGSTVGIIGLGNIGKIVARICALGLDMKVIGYDPYQDRNLLPDYIEKADVLDEVFRRADYLSLHLGITDETRGLIDIKRFKQMKPTAIFLNFARGAIVVEKDLIEALNTGVIAGAVLDVYENEPITGDNPLLEMENVLLSPHSAASTDEALTRTSCDGAKGIIEVLSGRKPTWCLNYYDVGAERLGGIS